MIQTTQLHICDVHRLIDFDCTPRLCNYCGMCDAYICAECSPNWPKRFKAAAKRMLEFGYKGLPNYEEVASKKES